MYKSKITLIIFTLLIVTLSINNVSAQIPPTPTNFLNTTGNFWINWTWQAGLGNNTNLYNISQNGTWINNTANNWSNVTVKPHDWSNISVCAYNNTGLGNWSSCWTGTKQVPNNNPDQTAIGSQTITEDSVLTITISSTDADSDTITYSTDASYGTLASNVFTWQPAIGTHGTYNWYFTTTDNQTPAGSDTETITITVNQYISGGAGYNPPSGGGGLPISTPISPLSSAIPKPVPAGILSTETTETGTGISTTPIIIGTFIAILMLLGWYAVSQSKKPKSRRRK
jgi:hypothetical protein